MLGAVEQMDLDGFYGVYRANGQGRAAYDPAMMVALLLYSYSVGLRSSRQVERACRGDVAFKVITAMQVPDHSTIAEFRRRHDVAIGELFVSVLGLCGEAGLVRVGEIAVDSTRMRANASRDRNRGYESIVGEILAEAERVDREEDERYGEARGDELPEQLRTREGRRAALKAARERLERERAAAVEAGEEVIERIELGLDRDRFPGSPDGRVAWLRQGRRELEARREREARPIPQSRSERVLEAKRRMDEELAYEHAANREYEHYRATGRASDGRRFGKPAKPYSPPLVPEGKINVTDPDSRELRTQGQPNIQGYNAQAVVTEQQIVIAAEIVIQSPDFGQLEPMVDAALRELDQAGVSERPRTVLADAGYWHTNQIEHLLADGFQVLVPPDSTVAEAPRRGWEGGMYSFMRRVLATDLGRELYIKRRHSIEPVFGQIKHNREMTRFRRRGRAAARSEWRLIAATHNLMKLHNHWIAPATA
ncbi:MAG: transposase [Solirubrobacterales bacterium]|nr:transposase [Solirubrobacterales bacterium]